MQENTDTAGIPAMVACPVSCGSGCALLHDDCASSPCQNGGTCTDRISAYDCSCVQGFFGHDCQNDECVDDITFQSFSGKQCTDYRGHKDSDNGWLGCRLDLGSGRDGPYIYASEACPQACATGCGCVNPPSCDGGVPMDVGGGH